MRTPRCAFIYSLFASILTHSFSPWFLLHVHLSHMQVRGALDVQRTAEAECEQFRSLASQFERDFRRMQTSYQAMVSECVVHPCCFVRHFSFSHFSSHPPRLTDHICTLTERLATKDASFLPANEDAREHAMRRLRFRRTLLTVLMPRSV